MLNWKAPKHSSRITYTPRSQSGIYLARSFE